MNNGMTNLITLTLIALIIIFGAMYFTSSMASLDAGTDVAGTKYEDAYETTTNTTIVTMSIISIVMYLIGVAAIIGALYMMSTMYRRR